MSNHARFSRYFEKFRYIQDADALNVDWAANSVYSVIAVGVNDTHSVPFCEYKIINNGVDLILTAPRYEVSKHQLDVFQFEFSRATKSEHVHIVEFADLIHFILRDPILELRADLILFRRGIPWKARVLFRFRF